MKFNWKNDIWLFVIIYDLINQGLNYETLS